MIYRERLRGGNVRGQMIASHLAWVRETHPDWLGPIGDIVSSETAALLSAEVDPDGWYPFRTLIELDRAIITLRGGGDSATARELGRYSAERSPALLAAPDLHTLLADSVGVHEKFEDFGSVAYEWLGETSCRISMRDCGCYSKLHCWSAAGYFERVAELFEVDAIEVVEDQCVCEAEVPSCDFLIRWRDRERAVD